MPTWLQTARIGSCRTNHLLDPALLCRLNITGSNYLVSALQRVLGPIQTSCDAAAKALDTHEVACFLGLVNSNRGGLLRVILASTLDIVYEENKRTVNRSQVRW